MFLDLDFTLLEMNPFTLDGAGKPFPLDMRGELDDTAAFKSGKKCAVLCASSSSLALDVAVKSVMLSALRPRKDMPLCSALTQLVSCVISALSKLVPGGADPFFAALCRSPIAAPGFASLMLKRSMKVELSGLGVPCVGRCRWSHIEFQLPLERSLTAAEEDIAGLDAATGASLKLSISILASWIGRLNVNRKLEQTPARVTRAGGATSSSRCLSGGR